MTWHVLLIRLWDELLNTWTIGEVIFLSFFSFYFASLIPSSAMYISFIIIPLTWRCFCRAESGGLNERVLYFWTPVMLDIYICVWQISE